MFCIFIRFMFLLLCHKTNLRFSSRLMCVYNFNSPFSSNFCPPQRPEFVETCTIYFQLTLGRFHSRFGSNIYWIFFSPHLCYNVLQHKLGSVFIYNFMRIFFRFWFRSSSRKRTKYIADHMLHHTRTFKFHGFSKWGRNKVIVYLMGA